MLIFPGEKYIHTFICFLHVWLIEKGLFSRVSVILLKIKQEHIVLERSARFHIDLKFSTNRNLVEVRNGEGEKYWRRIIRNLVDSFGQIKYFLGQKQFSLGKK